MYERLKSPLKIGKLTLPNRLAMTAMGINLGKPEGGVTDDLIAFYQARAQGGVGLIITEVTRIEGGAGISDPCQMAAYRPGDILEIQRLVDAIHRWNSRLFVQLQHPGRAASSWVAGVQPVSSSAVASPMGGEVPRALSLSECKEMAGRFVNAAHIAQMAGADGIELHGAHGYLINQFLSPAMNYREDEYGGSFENRMRFILEILQGIQETCGQRFPVSVRINAQEALPGGIDQPEAARIAKALQDAGASLINVSCYTEGCIEPGTYSQGWKKHMAQCIKQSVSIPVLSVCNIKEPEAAEKLLEESACDLVGLGRALLADPDWPRKAFSGRESEIRTCIGCLSCFGEICSLKRINCAVNPLTGHEREYGHPLVNGAGRTVAVVGGGPAGVQAALTLKERGFAPVLFDENATTGGALNIADKGHGKEKITRLTQSLHTQLEKAGVRLRLGERATVESLDKINPEAVFLACGAEPFLPPVEGINKNHVVTAESVLLGQTDPKGRVAVIGAGMTGLETAELLALKGREVTIVEMLDTLGVGAYPAVVSDIMGRVLPQGTQVLLGHKLISVGDNEVNLQRLADSQNVTIAADWVVMAVGVSPRRSLADACGERFGQVQVIGDALKPGRILEAMQDAQGKAFVFDPDQN
ncbi:MAG: NAD(P)/FAD-dependent oxidoreductase [Eubacteriales bacterium]|nr:NAD(P)/FAD-dependent oxidoreductase [Eubacteriales bacterium]